MRVERRRSPQPASPAVAAFLSFVLPGLGQLAVGAFRRALILGLPVVAVVALTVLLLTIDRADAIGALVRPDVVLAIVALDLVLGLIHLIAIGDAYRLARRRVARSAFQVRPGAPGLLALLLAITIAIHGGLGAFGVQAYNTMAAIYQRPGSSFQIPVGTFSPVETVPPGANPTPDPTASPVPGPAWAADGRLDVLLIGGDAGPGRWNLRTDTLILFSADVATGRAALFGIPRNLYNVPLPPESEDAFPGGVFPFPNLINGLWVYADGHRDLFPGGDDAGFRAITGAVQQLVGVPLDGAVVVNLNGFVDLVDALGGVWIDVPSRMYDARYPNEDGTGHVEILIKAGCRKLDGHYALAFARIRHIDSDYHRMGRQQVVLEALARQLDPIALITQAPKLLQIAGDNLRTTFQPDDIGPLAEFAMTIDRARIRNLLFVPPTYPEYLTPSVVKQIQKVVRNAFATPSPNPSATPAPSRTPRPTAEPCPPS